ncbi:hypothetical protein [Desulfosporosinus sp. FKA]|uniref:hypothetical protein n=1 Tax=Desulfosporosinus sp. FKA TaxID=1969834 RepID=UPI000B49F4F9|nr:hypothetical protein [Desulfosporosinus sp. FKA]
MKTEVLKKVLTDILGSLIAQDKTIDNNTRPDDNHNVVKIEDTEEMLVIKRVCHDFAKALTERNYESLDGRAEYHLYTVDHLIKLVKNNDEENTIKILTDNKIKSKYEDCEFLSITLSENQEEAEVVYNVKTCVISAEDKYFKELNKKNNKKNRIVRGTPFSTAYTLLIKKEKGTWKVDNFEASEENIKME